jgi:hypothetical protein
VCAAGFQSFCPINVSKGALSCTTQYYKSTSFDPFFGSSSNLYTITRERNYKHFSVSLRERDIFLDIDVLNFVKMRMVSGNNVK